jgi:hypothetical protein
MNGFTNTLKTWTLLAALGGLLVVVGSLRLYAGSVR